MKYLKKLMMCVAFLLFATAGGFAMGGPGADGGCSAAAAKSMSPRGSFRTMRAFSESFDVEIPGDLDTCCAKRDGHTPFKATITVDLVAERPAGLGKGSGIRVQKAGCNFICAKGPDVLRHYLDESGLLQREAGIFLYVKTTCCHLKKAFRPHLTETKDEGRVSYFSGIIGDGFLSEESITKAKPEILKNLGLAEEDDTSVGA